MARFYFMPNVCVIHQDECLNVESLNDIEKYFSKDNWLHRCYINNLYVKFLEVEGDFRYAVYADIFENEMMNHLIGHSDSMLEYRSSR